MDPRLRVIDVRFLPLGDESVVALPLAGAVEPRIVAEHEAELARRCATFATLGEHARARCAELDLGDDSVAEMQEQIAALAELGLLESHDEIVMTARGTVERLAEPGVTIGTLGVITCDRPAALVRGLTSYLSNARRHGHDPEVVVMDDATTDEGAARTRADLAAFAREQGARVLYADRRRRAAWAGRLAEHSGVPESIARFAVLGSAAFPPPIGANRNSLLLETTGRPFLSIDDDTICRLGRVIGARPGVDVGSESPPLEQWSFATREAALAAVPEEDLDLLGAHEAVLGRTAAGCLTTLGPGEVDLSRSTPALAALVRAGGGRVVASYSAILGDSGAGDAEPLLDTEGDTFARLFATEQAWRVASTSREILRGVRRPWIGDGRWCMATVVGLDNRALLPPFVPGLYAEDVLWGYHLRCASHDALLAHLPIAALHAPIDPRRNPGGVGNDPVRMFSVQVLIEALLGMERPRAATLCDESMRRTGAALQELGSLGPSRFRAWARERWIESGAGAAGRAEARLAIEGGPDYWRAEVRARSDKARRWLLSGDFLDLGGSAPSDPEAALEQTRVLLREFGAVVTAWPALVASGRALREHSEGLAVPL